jgi:hypothetical protein
MNPERAKQLILDYGWDATERRRVAAALRLAEHDADCAAAVQDYDQIRAALRDDETVARAALGGPGDERDRKLGAPKAEAVEAVEAIEAEGDQGQAEPLDEPADGWVAYEARLLGAVRRRPRWSWRQAGAIAATLILGVLLGWKVLPRPAAPGLPPIVSPTAGLAFSPAEIKSRVSTFWQIADVFEHRTSWVVVTKGASDLGLAADPKAAAGDLMLLRLALLRGDAVLSQADVVIVPGQAAELTLPLGDGENVRYLLATSEEDPARLSLYAELRGGRHPDQALGAVGSDLRIRPGEVCAAGQVLTTQGEYAVAVASARAGGGARP